MTPPPLLCVDKWRSQWHYRNNKVVVGDDVVYENLNDASIALNISIFTLHKLIVRMWPLDGDDVSYAVYKDDKASNKYDYRHGDKKVAIPSNPSRKRSRGHDHQDPVPSPKMQKHRHQNLGVCNSVS